MQRPKEKTLMVIEKMWDKDRRIAEIIRIGETIMMKRQTIKIKYLKVDPTIQRRKSDKNKIL